MTICPTCGQENPEGFRFCGACGAPLAEVPPSRHERKVITALFCDLVGSTAAGERLDPEDFQALLSRYHRQVRSELERFGATVEKFIGDAVVALFGAPLAHEDDPERAVRAALAVREWVRQQPDLHVRIAANTGEALVMLGAHADQGDHVAAGDVLNTAARLQSAAPVDGILVGEQTYRATERLIEYREHAPVQAEGKVVPVRAWEALGARSRLGIDVEQAPRTRLVGRQRELRLLTESFERTREEREPQLVTLIGVPGIGKSRIVYELSRIADADPGLITWRQGRCLPYGEAVSFWALSEIVKAQAGILESDGPDAVEAKLEGSVAGLVPAADVEWVLRWLRPLLGRGGEARSDGARAESFPAWRRFLEGIAERAPSVVVFEDLHWADEGLLDFIDELAEWTTGVPLLIVCTARPELLTKRPSWGAGQTNALALRLSPLSAQQTAQLVHDLLDQAVLPDELQLTLLDRAGGNPLYAEEFARMVTERGTPEPALPDSVHGIIAARLDALSPEHKALLQDAAVIGKVFWASAIEALHGAPLDDLEHKLRELERRELIRRERQSSVEGQTEYAFRHVLTRDVAYAQMPRGERSERHRRAAEWIHSLGRSDDHAELLAHHYREALGYTRASGGDVATFAARARTALHEAGERAMALGAYPSALQHFRTGLGLVPEDDPERGGWLYDYGVALYWAENRGAEELGEALGLLEQRDPETAARAALLLARLEWLRGDRAAASGWLGTVDRLLNSLPDSIVQTEALVARAGFEMVGSEYEQAIRLAREALDRIDGLDRPDLLARIFDVIGLSRVGLGDEGGLDDERRAAQIAHEGRGVRELHRVLSNLASSMSQLGLLKELDQNLDERQRAFEQIGVTVDTRQWFLADQTYADYVAGRWDHALERSGGLLAQLEEGESHYLEASVRPTRAAIEIALDQTSAARADVDRAVALAVRSRDPQALAWSLCCRASILVAERETAAALADFEELLALGDRLGAGLNTEAAMPAFAWLAVDLGRTSEAETVVNGSRVPRWKDAANAILAGEPATAADLLSSIGHRPAEAYARLRAGGPHLRQALAFYRAVGASRYIRAAELQLAASA